MTEHSAGGFSVLDGIALVAGAAVASVHIRGALRDDTAGAAWLVVWGSFAWIALTSAGPFVYLVRRYARRVAGHPGVGDRLWALLGLPWLLTALLQTSQTGSEPARNELFAGGLSIGLAIVCMIALAVVWKTWVMVTPGRASQTFAGPWTNRLGLILAVAWPVQCGVGMVVIG